MASRGRRGGRGARVVGGVGPVPCVAEYVRGMGRAARDNDMITRVDKPLRLC